ncbi:MAG: fibronectin type III domain-containing protein [Candidatus Saganbacteria bacterium]|nr:fibronectin type III domain-containing protein [Candidatus Saganbacteria bacterium]
MASWESAEGATGYQVKVYLSNGTTLVTTVTTTGADGTGKEFTWLKIPSVLSANTTYKADVTAYYYASAGGTSIPQVSFTTLATPLAPKGLTIFDINMKSAMASWEAAEGADNYLVTIYAVNGTTVVTTVPTSGADPITGKPFTWLRVTGLTGNTDYKAVVTAKVGGAIGGTSSPQVPFTTKDMPDVPTHLTVAVDAIGSTWAVPSWWSVEGATGYTVSYGTNAAADNIGTATTVETLARLINLNPETQYYVKVKADSTGYPSSAYSAAVAFTTKVIEVPTNLVVNVDAISSTWAIPSWWSVAGATGYTVSYGTDAAATNLGTLPTTEALIKLINLNPETQYYVKVRADKTGKTSSAYSAAVAFTTKVNLFNLGNTFMVECSRSNRVYG